MNARGKEIREAIHAGEYEQVGAGELLLPEQGIKIGGYFEHEVVHADGTSDGVQRDFNIVVNEGLDHVLDSTLSAATQLTSWYVAIFEANYTPVAADVASGIASASTESTAYAESVRQTWTDAGASSQSITNSASKATFTINATKTIYGAFLISDSTKSGTAGTLMAASQFSASRSVVNTDQLLITYTLSIADA